MNEFYNRFAVAREINKVREADKKIFSKSQEQMEKEIESLKRQLQAAATLLSCERCPGEKDGSHCSKDAKCVDCWLEYWRQKANFKDNGANSDDKAANSKDKEAGK